MYGKISKNMLQRKKKIYIHPLHKTLRENTEIDNKHKLTFIQTFLYSSTNKLTYL